MYHVLASTAKSTRGRSCREYYLRAESIRGNTVFAGVRYNIRHSLRRRREVNSATYLAARNAMEKRLLYVMHMFLGLVTALRSNELNGSLNAAATEKSCENFHTRDGISASGTGGFFIYSYLMKNKGLFEAGNVYQGDANYD